MERTHDKAGGDLTKITTKLDRVSTASPAAPVKAYARAFSAVGASKAHRLRRARPRTRC